MYVRVWEKKEKGDRRLFHRLGKFSGPPDFGGRWVVVARVPWGAEAMEEKRGAGESVFGAAVDWCKADGPKVFAEWQGERENMHNWNKRREGEKNREKKKKEEKKRRKKEIRIREIYGGRVR